MKYLLMFVLYAHFLFVCSDDDDDVIVCLFNFYFNMNIHFLFSSLSTGNSTYTDIESTVFSSLLIVVVSFRLFSSSS